MIREAIRKQLTKLLFPNTYSSLFMPRSRYNYEREINGWQSSIIMACVGWIQRTFPEAPLMVQKRGTDEEWENVPDIEILSLLDYPNPYYDGLLLQSASIADLVISGNAYLLKVRSGAGRVVQLWWTPSTLIEPKWPMDGSEFLSHYDYMPGGGQVRIEPKDLVHYRLGIDPDNLRKGRSPLQSLLREVFTDDEAANMTATLLRNMGVPGLLISPEKDSSVSPQDADAVKQYIKERTTGDRRGEPLIIGAPTHVDAFGFNPQQMDMKQLRRIPEERISAVLGIPAVVVGLGAGLDRSTYANMAEAREMAYESGIIPLQRIVASQTKHQLLSEYVDEADLVNWRVAYDLSEIRVLQEDEDKLSTRTIAQVNGGVCKVIDAQRILGLPEDESQDFYLRNFNALAVRSGETGDETLAPQDTTSPTGAPEDTAQNIVSGEKLNGIQIQASLDVIGRLIDGLIPAVVALELLVAVGIDRDRAERMITAASKFKPAKRNEKALKSAEWTEEHKAAYWKRQDRERVGWWGLAFQKIEPLYFDEGKAVAKAVSKGSSNMIGAAESTIKSLADKWMEVIEKLTFNIVEHFGSEIAPETSGKQVGNFDPTHELIRNWIVKHAAESVKSILETNLADVRAVILAGINEGLTTTQIGRKLRDFYSDRSSMKAMRVARTEVTQSAGFAQHESAIQSGVMKRHQWLSSRDERVRDSHIAIDGEEKLINEPYSNGLMFPGDPSGDPAETIQCRCVEMFTP